MESLNLLGNTLGDGIGGIELIDFLGGDISIVNAARVSYLGKPKGNDRDKKLLRYLWKNKHSSPFEMCSFKVIIVCPLFVRSQIMRHRTFSYNEVSRRYTQDELSFYYPINWRLQDTVNRQGSVEEVSNDPTVDERVKNLTEKALSLYYELLKQNISREQAHMVLPQNLYTKFVMFGNLRNWLHFCTLRCDSHAQWETRQFALAIRDRIIRPLFPWTYEVYMEDITTNPTQTT